MNCIITGASRGIGAALARELARKNVSRILIASRNESSLNSLKNSLNEQYPDTDVLVLPVDLSSDKDTGRLVVFAAEHMDRLDLLINNAGAMVKKPFDQSLSVDIESVFRVNYFAPSLLISRLMPLLLRSERAHVVNIGSMGGMQGTKKFPGLAHYSASKAALAVLTECLAEEYKSTSIHFNCLALGAAQTEMLSEAFPGYRAPVSAKEMADFIADFALQGARLFNGKILPVALSTP
jgi:short-subunit dehydrogenase